MSLFSLLNTVSIILTKTYHHFNHSFRPSEPHMLIVVTNPLTVRSLLLEGMHEKENMLQVPKTETIY